MGLGLNDKVAVLDDDLEGKIINIDGDSVQIETTEGFVMNFSASELVKMETSFDELATENEEDFRKIIEEKRQPKKSKSIRVKPKERNTPPMEVDLHIDKLVSSTRGMNNYDMLSLQLETVKRQLEFAMKKRIQKVVFIHGVGEGVLKAELDYLLNRYDNLKFYDANFQKYGVGATEVYFFQNF